MEKETPVKMYFKGGKGIVKPVDFDGKEIKAGDILTTDGWGNDVFYHTYWPKWSEQDIANYKNRPMYLVKWNEKGFFYADGINQDLYLHDFRFKFTKIILNPLHPHAWAINKDK